MVPTQKSPGPSGGRFAVRFAAAFRTATCGQTVTQPPAAHHAPTTSAPVEPLIDRLIAKSQPTRPSDGSATSTPMHHVRCPALPGASRAGPGLSPPARQVLSWHHRPDHRPRGQPSECEGVRATGTKWRAAGCRVQEPLVHVRSPVTQSRRLAGSRAGSAWPGSGLLLTPSQARLSSKRCGSGRSAAAGHLSVVVKFRVSRQPGLSGSGSTLGGDVRW